MAGNVESELREAMAEQVSGLNAPRSLAHTVIRRHRRRVIRTRLIVAATVVGAAAAGGLPAFRALTPGRPADPAQPGVVAGSATPLPTPGDGASPASGPGGAPRPRTPNPGDSGREQGSDAGRRTSRPGGAVRLGYLPPGLRPDGRCETSPTVAGRRTTSCRWKGGDGLDTSWIEVRVVRGPGVSGADDLEFPAARTEPGRVGGRPAVIGVRPDGSRQVVWTVRDGVGAYVAAGGRARDDLLKIADGLEVTP